MGRVVGRRAERLPGREVGRYKYKGASKPKKKKAAGAQKRSRLAVAGTDPITLTNPRGKAFNYEPSIAEVVHEYPLLPSEARAFRIAEHPPVPVWAEKEFILTKSYVNPGRFFARPWQREPLDAIRHFNKVYFVAPVQTGKSMLAEICCAYAMVHWAMSGMLMYANEKTATKVFKFRLRPLVEQVPALRALWSGNDDDLTVKNIELLNCVWGIASAQNKDDIASFPAVFGYASECSKYKSKEFNPLDMLRGRQQAALSNGYFKLLFESSPWEVGDIYHKEIYQKGTIVLDPHFKCVHCGAWIVFTDHNIVETGDRDHDPARIRAEKEKAVRYECNSCGAAISEAERCRMLDRCVWAATNIEEGKFKQVAEAITAGGEILTDRKKYDAVCYHWNRLVDYGYTFHECLARFYSARISPDKWRIYETEDMARFWRGSSGDRPTGESLRAHCADYSQGSVPADVVIATCGLDTQDDGFYYVIRGYGANMQTWLLRHGFIDCNVKKEIYKRKEMVLAEFNRELMEKPLKYADGRTLPVYFGFQDRGGHRPHDVDYLCKNVPWLHSYIGLTKPDPKKPLVQKAVKDKWYLGQTRLLSELVAQYMDSDAWYLPDDVGSDYLDQVVAQYAIEEEDTHGQPKIKWICEKNDHYRDCENYNFAAVKHLKLDEMLFTEEGVRRVRQRLEVKPVVVKTPESDKPKRPAPVRVMPGQRYRPARTWSR